MKRIKLIMLTVLSIITLMSCEKKRTIICYQKTDTIKQTMIVLEGTDRYVEEQVNKHKDVWNCGCEK